MLAKLQKFGAGILAWITWLKPAFTDTTDEYVGEEYQKEAQAFLTLGVTVVIVTIILVTALQDFWWICLLSAASLYLLIGAFYCHNKTRWGS